MRRPFVATLLIIAMALLFMGMEGLGGSSEKFPMPKLNYKAVVTDMEAVEHQAHHVSVNGKTSLSGFRGKASLSVDFRRIDRVTISKGDTKTYVYAHVVLRNGREVDLKVKGLTRCYGVTDLGEMSVRMRDIKSIVFDKTPPEPEE